MINELIFLSGWQAWNIMMICIFSFTMLVFLSMDDFKPTLNLFRRNPVLWFCFYIITMSLINMMENALRIRSLLK